MASSCRATDDERDRARRWRQSVKADVTVGVIRYAPGMADPGKPREATYQDVLEAPDHMVAEVLDGELILSPRPAFIHQRSQLKLASRLGFSFDFGEGGPGGWYFLPEVELHLGKDILVPDLAGWRKERLPEAARQAAFATIAPDWICEGLSPSTERLDRVRKLPLYAKAGIHHAWLLDAREQKLFVHGLVDGRYELVQMFFGGDLVRAQPFEELELTFDKIMDVPTRASEGTVAYGG